MATFIQHGKLLGEIAGQRVNFDVALVTTSQNTSFCKWCKILSKTKKEL